MRCLQWGSHERVGGAVLSALWPVTHCSSDACRMTTLAAPSSVDPLLRVPSLSWDSVCRPKVPSQGEVGGAPWGTARGTLLQSTHPEGHFLPATSLGTGVGRTLCRVSLDTQEGELLRGHHQPQHQVTAHPSWTRDLG